MSVNTATAPKAAQYLQAPPYNENIGHYVPTDAIGSQFQLNSFAKPTNTILCANLAFGHKSQRMMCPYCNVQMMTRLKYRAAMRTHVMAFAFCITGLICLVPLPYLMKSCRKLDHYCNNCAQFLGVSKEL